MTATQNPAPKCELCGRAIRRNNLSLTSSKWATGYRHMACNERQQAAEADSNEQYRPGDRVYRWWFVYSESANAQPLTVVRVNRKTVTVRTDQGSEFRIDPQNIAGRWSDG